MRGGAALCCLGALLCSPTARAASPWQDFPVIEWQSRTPAQLATLRSLGVTAGAVLADRDGSGASERRAVRELHAAGMGFYIENAATDFYAPYHRYDPVKPVNDQFLTAQAAYRARPDDTSLLQRQPGFLDPVWQSRVVQRLTAIVRRNSKYHPLFYNLADEAGIADLSAFWDFDTSEASIAGMRTWLRGEYGSLAALNAEWGTHFQRWDAVQPELTRTAMRRADDNFAAWSDFKAWMDVSFARALRTGTNAVHAAAPKALAGIEGAQKPGWGGYDYTQLADAVDVMEVYDSGENLPIIRSLNPGLIPLRTIGGDTRTELHAVWRSVLRGVRGLVVWDEGSDLVRADGSPGPRAATLKPLFDALHGPQGQSLARATPHDDPIAILYSPESFRVQWMLDHRAAGDAWMARGAEMENEDGPYRHALQGYATSLAGLHLQPRFVSVADLINHRFGARALILPGAVALPPEAAAAIQSFARHGGVVIADTQPGVFDGHGRRLPRPPAIPFQQLDPADTTALRSALGITSRIGVEAGQPIEAHFYRLGGSTLLALQPHEPAAQPVATTLLLRTPASVRNLATKDVLPRSNLIPLVLDPGMPTLLELRP